LLDRLGVADQDWDDLLNPKLKGQIAQCTLIDPAPAMQLRGDPFHAWMGKGWEWLKKLAANTEFSRPVS